MPRTLVLLLALLLTGCSGTGSPDGGTTTCYSGSYASHPPGTEVPLSECSPAG